MTSELPTLLLPGQPITLPKGPAAQLGAGTYVRDGKLRASLVGVPRFTGGVSPLPLFLEAKLNPLSDRLYH